MSLLDGYGTPDFLPGMTGQTALANGQTLYTLSNVTPTTVVLYQPSGFHTLQMFGAVTGAGTADFLTIVVSNDVNGSVINNPMIRRYTVPSTGFFLRLPQWGTIAQVTILSSVNNAQLTLFAIFDSLDFPTFQDLKTGPRALWVNASLPPGFSTTALQAFAGLAKIQAIVPVGTSLQLTVNSKDPQGGADVNVYQWSQANFVATRMTVDVILPPEAWYLTWNNIDAGNQTVYVTVTPLESSVL